MIRFLFLILLISQTAHASCSSFWSSCWNGFTSCCKKTEKDISNVTGKITSNFLSNVVTQSYIDPTTHHSMLSVSVSVPHTTFNMPGFSWDVKNPSSLLSYGTVSLSTGLSSGGATDNVYTVILDLTDLSSLPATPAAQLPNGNPLPLTLVGGGVIQQIPVADTGIQIYYATNPTTSLVGFTIPVAELNTTGNMISGVNLFPILPFGKVIASAGFYTGSSNQTGLGAFVEIPMPGSTSILSLSSSLPTREQMDYMTSNTDLVLNRTGGFLSAPSSKMASGLTIK